MTPESQARAGYRRPQVRRADSGATNRSGETAAVPGARERAAVSGRAAARAERRAREDTSIVKVIPLLAVLVVTAAGIYIAWDKGSAGGGAGGVVAGAALLAAAVARLLLPSRLVGLLATRKRVIDVLTLAAFGVALLVGGLVLPG